MGMLESVAATSVRVVGIRGVLIQNIFIPVQIKLILRIEIETAPHSEEKHIL
jgi:hypothetical protein